MNPTTEQDPQFNWVLVVLVFTAIVILGKAILYQLTLQ